MLKNYLYVSVRTLMRHKGFTGITVLGLALSMAVCLMILTFIWDQKQYDRFHTRTDDIYRILADRVDSDGDVDALAATPAPLADALLREVPGIEATLRLGQIRSQAVYEGKAVYLEGLYVEPSFFDMFSFTLENGDPRSLLDTPNQLLLSHGAAEKLFGTRNPVGEPLRLEGHGDFIVGGLLAEPPGKSHLKFDVLVSFSTLSTSHRSDALADWMNWWQFATYLMTDAPETLDRLEAVLPEITRQHYEGQESRLDFHVQALKDIALGPPLGNEISSYSVPALVVYFLAVLGLIIMVSAGFNYVSLSVARAMKRAREIGVRKAVGARRLHVVLQFLCEAVLIALLALVLAYAMLSWLLPAFNGLTFIQMARVEIDPVRLFAPALLGLFMLFSIGVGVMAGLYPALRLSRFQPVTVLKGLNTTHGFSGRLLRRSLTGVQFAVGLFFVTTTLLLLAQFNYLLHADYGFARHDLINVDLQGQPFDVLREELLRHPSIVAVSGTSKLPASGSTSRIELLREGMQESVPAYEYAIDPAFLDNLDLPLVAGRTFSSDRASDSTQAVLLNETAVGRLGLDTPASAIGTFLRMDEAAPSVQVIGVVKDYQYNTLMDPIDALVLHYTPRAFRYANIRTRPGEMASATAHLEAVWKQLDPVHPIDYSPFDVQLTDNIFNRIFEDLAYLIAFIALLAVLISCLGLFGMVLYLVETRVKEVGLRKVLGADNRSIVLLLSREFLWMIGIAGAATLPLAWLGNGLWLQAFANRIALSPWLFAGAALLMTALALLVIASQTIRAAKADPVQSLRYE